MGAALVIAAVAVGWLAGATVVGVIIGRVIRLADNERRTAKEAA